MGKSANTIDLIVHKTAKKAERRCVQISGEANNVLMGLCRATGLPIGHIVSQMIIQGAEFINIIEEDD